jgi:hypothetical protein
MHVRTYPDYRDPFPAKKDYRDPCMQTITTLILNHFSKVQTDLYMCWRTKKNSLLVLMSVRPVWQERSFKEKTDM